jgi:hypothetical protein
MCVSDKVMQQNISLILALLKKNVPLEVKQTVVTAIGDFIRKA